MLDVLRSGQLSLGPRVEMFEEMFGANVGAQFASAVSSGTAGLHLAVRAVGVEAGDEVVTSPFSFVASANAVVYEGATPVFADIDPVTLNLDPKAAEAAVTERTTAVLPVHIFGYPADMPAFEQIAAKHGLAIVEDACEALGARHGDGVAVGGRNNPAVFGFYANKQITTGEGGMVTLADRSMKERIDSERNRGGRRTWGGWITIGWGSTTGCRMWRVRWGSLSWGGWRGCWRTGRGSPGGIGRRWGRWPIRRPRQSC